jgi:hypothetical protein
MRAGRGKVAVVFIAGSLSRNSAQRTRFARLHMAVSATLEPPFAACALYSTGLIEAKRACAGCLGFFGIGKER